MGGLFDWFWEFLYGLTKSLFRIIDGLMFCANKLCGIDPILVDDEEVDFLNYLITNERIMLVFEVATICGLVVVMAFSIFSMIKSITGKQETTPMQVFVKAFKTILMFLFVPVCMVAFIYFGNAIMETMYNALVGTNHDGIGRFLVGAFSQDALRASTSPTFYLDPSFNYMSTSDMWSYINLSDFDFLFSWIAGACILLTLGQTLLMFVDRAISIVILFIVSPFSISTTIIDDGGRFKLWRDQVLVKFLTGYGCILGINVYILVVSLITSNSVVFFTTPFYNNLMKIGFIVGGALSMQRVMALIGNLISAGAGTNEMRENAMANAGAARVLGGVKSAFTSPFRATRSAINFGKETKQYGFGTALGGALGLKTGKDYGARSKTQREAYEEKLNQRDAHTKRNNKEFSDQVRDSVMNAINGRGSNASLSDELYGGNSNNNKAPEHKNNDLITNAIKNNSNSNQDKK